MKLYKVYIFIAVVFMELCAFNAVDAIRIDSLNNTRSLQPPPLNVQPNISGSINSNVKQSQPKQNPLNSDFSNSPTAPDSNKKNLNNNQTAPKNILHSYIFIWFIIILIIVIFFILIFLHANKKMKKALR